MFDVAIGCSSPIGGASVGSQDQGQSHLRHRQHDMSTVWILSYSEWERSQELQRIPPTVFPDPSWEPSRCRSHVKARARCRPRPTFSGTCRRSSVETQEENRASRRGAAKCAPHLPRRPLTRRGRGEEQPEWCHRNTGTDPLHPSH
jgi:hypothetical protein